MHRAQSHSAFNKLSMGQYTTLSFHPRTETFSVLTILSKQTDYIYDLKGFIKLSKIRQVSQNLHTSDI